MNQVTTVLSVVNRPEYLPSQLDCIENQSITSDIFLIWRNPQKYNLDFPAITYHSESPHFNSLYGRFYNSLHIQTPYVFICDDDLLPGRKYLERCIEFSKKNNDNVVVSSFGLVFPKNAREYKPTTRLSQNIFLQHPFKVDMGGQGWFMKTELIKYFLHRPPLELNTGEDLHFSFCLYENNIPIYVLDKDKKNKETWQDITLGERGMDEKAQYKSNKNHFPLRNALVSKYVELGWEFGKPSQLL